MVGDILGLGHSGAAAIRATLPTGGSRSGGDGLYSRVQYATCQSVATGGVVAVLDGSTAAVVVKVAQHLTASALVGRRVVVAGRSASDWLVIAAV